MKLYRISLFCFLGILFTNSAVAFEAVLEITRDELQARVDKFFPITTDQILFRLTVLNPVVNLHPKQNRMAVALTVQAHIDSALVGKGVGEVEGVPIYKAEKGEFYLSDSRLTQLQIDGVPTEIMPDIKAVTSGLLSNVLQDLPVFVLDDSDLRQRFLRRRLISIEVQEGKLIAKYEM